MSRKETPPNTDNVSDNDEPPPRREKPPEWQEGEMEIVIPLSDDDITYLRSFDPTFTDDKLRLKLSWSLDGKRKRKADDQGLIRYYQCVSIGQMKLAEEDLAEAERHLSSGADPYSWLQKCEDALCHAMTAWHDAEFVGHDASDTHLRRCFDDHAPKALRAIESNARYRLRHFDWTDFDEEGNEIPMQPRPEDYPAIFDAVRVAVDALIAAARTANLRRGPFSLQRNPGEAPR